MIFGMVVRPIMSKLPDRDLLGRHNQLLALPVHTNRRFPIAGDDIEREHGDVILDLLLVEEAADEALGVVPEDVNLS